MIVAGNVKEVFIIFHHFFSLVSVCLIVSYAVALYRLPCNLACRLGHGLSPYSRPRGAPACKYIFKQALRDVCCMALTFREKKC